MHTASVAGAGMAIATAASAYPTATAAIRLLSRRCLHTANLTLAAPLTARPSPAAAQTAIQNASRKDWGPAAHKLPLESLTSSPRVNRRPPSPPGSPQWQPIKLARLQHEHPNSTTVKYKIMSAAVVERWPRVEREMDEWTRKYHEHFAPLRAAKQAKHQPPEELAPKIEDAQLFPTKEQAISGEYAPVPPEALLTEADHANDLHSPHRCLQDSLYLVVKRKGDSSWCFPQAEVPESAYMAGSGVPTAAEVAAAVAASQGLAAVSIAPPPQGPAHPTNRKGGSGISLRSVATQAFKDILGSRAAVYWIGNAPLAVHRQVKDLKAVADALEKEKEREQTMIAEARSALEAAAPGQSPNPIPEAQPLPDIHAGTKTFYMHALYMDGEIRIVNAKEYEDFAWVRIVDLPRYIGAEQAEIMNKVLLDINRTATLK